MSDDDQGVTQAKRLILNIAEEAMLIRSAFISQKANGSGDPRVLNELRSNAVRYFEVLREHRFETAIKDEWAETDLPEFERLLRETTVVEQQRAGYAAGVDRVEVPKLREADPWFLVDIIRQLDDIRKELKISAAGPDVTPKDDVGLEDIRELQKGRGQEEAADRIPARGEANDE